MTSILKVDTIQDTAGNNIINESSDTITIGASGDTVNIVGTLQNNGSGLASGITEADQWRISANYSYSGSQADVDLTTNWERVDTDGFGLIGTGMTESSGIFTFPSTGIYLITFTFFADNTTAVGNNRFVGGGAKTTLDNSTYNLASQTYSNIPSAAMSKDGFCSGSSQHQFDVTDVTTHKIKFSVTANLNSTTFQGSTSASFTAVSFIRLGDT
jgi:hypothetical protein